MLHPFFSNELWMAQHQLGQQTDYDRLMLRLAYWTAARFSDDPRTQNGALLVEPDGAIIGAGANRFPDYVDKTVKGRLEAPVKYQWLEHAERNAVYSAGRAGHCTEGAIMYCPWFACTDCARAIIQAGIKTVIGHKDIFVHSNAHWTDEISEADVMLKEAHVVTRYFEGPIGEVTIKFKGADYSP